MQLLWELERSGWNDTNKEFNFETMLTEKYREGMIDDIMDSIVPKGDQEDENNPFAGHSSPTLPPSPSPLDEWARKDGDGNTETQEAVQAAAEVKKRLQIGDEKGVREMLSQLNLDTLEKLSGEDHDPGVREMSKEDEARDKRAAQHIDRIEQRRVAQPDDLAWWEIDPRSGPPGGPSVGEWNETRVKQWAVEENMPMHLRQSLEENFINGNILLKYTDRMMEKDGLKRGQRAMLLQYIKLLKAKERARWGPKSIELEPYLWIDFEPEHEDHPAPEWNHVVAPSTQRAQAAPVEDESEKDLESIYGDDNSDS
uniref:SAM domain-containing protein n=2 Tax=Lotharella globosa TaxID=91324 RepID=A0A6V3MGC3_9EUKA